MRVVLTAAASADLNQATRWYHNQADGLAARFLNEYEALLTRLADSFPPFAAKRAGQRFAAFLMACFSVCGIIGLRCSPVSTLAAILPVGSGAVDHGADGTAYAQMSANRLPGSSELYLSRQPSLPVALEFGTRRSNPAPTAFTAPL